MLTELTVFSVNHVGFTCTALRWEETSPLDPIMIEDDLAEELHAEPLLQPQI